MERVVVTGIGVVSAIGTGREEFWQNLIAGKNGIKPITAFDTTDHKVKVAAEITDFNPENFMPKKEVRRTDRFCQFAIAATQLAKEDGNIDFDKLDKNRIGALVSSGIGGMQTFEKEYTKLIKKGPNRISPFMVPMLISNIAAGNISIRYGLKGPSFCVTSACASSAHAAGEAFRNIKHGYNDMVVVGGAEATVTPFAMAGFANMRALSDTDDVNKASIPFDARRSGFVMGEGGAVIILESLTSAKKRDAKIYGELKGYGATSDAYHITSPDPEGQGAGRAMKLALEEGNIDKDEINYINAHGTGTPLNDKIETKAVKGVFGEKVKNVAISSSKSMFGHLLGAAGAMEAAATVLAIENNIAPPTINYQEKDPECDLDYVPNEKRAMQIDAALSNALGFGGHNSSLLFTKYRD